MDISLENADDVLRYVLFNSVMRLWSEPTLSSQRVDPLTPCSFVIYIMHHVLTLSSVIKRRQGDGFCFVIVLSSRTFIISEELYNNHLSNLCCMAHRLHVLAFKESNGHPMPQHDSGERYISPSNVIRNSISQPGKTMSKRPSETPITHPE